jgi:hypothetical protein
MKLQYLVIGSLELIYRSDSDVDVGAHGRARLHQHRNSNGCKFCYKNWVNTLTPNVFRILLQF